MVIGIIVAKPEYGPSFLATIGNKRAQHQNQFAFVAVHTPSLQAVLHETDGMEETLISN